MNQLGLGNKISRLRQNKNMTQEELAGRIGVTPQALSRWERDQSLPDLVILTDLCRILGVSADYMLGTESGKITENGDNKIQDEIWRRLRNCMEPLELVFGKDLVSAFSDDSFTELIVEWRRKLADEGILMPVVRVRDQFLLEPNEFMVLSYQKVLYSEQIEQVNENTCEYMIAQLGKTVREKYADILNRDLVKGLTDNLGIKYPALIAGTVPERISYGILTDVLKGILNRGQSVACLVKVIEILDGVLRQSPEASLEELVDRVAEELQTKENFRSVVEGRK